jgi:hypothetical protein
MPISSTCAKGHENNEVLIMIYSFVVLTQTLANPTEFQHKKCKKILYENVTAHKFIIKLG